MMDLSFLVEGLGDGVGSVEQVICLTAGYNSWSMHERAIMGCCEQPPRPSVDEEFQSLAYDVNRWP